MARLLLWLILADACVVLAMAADEKSQNPTEALSPSHLHEQGMAGAPAIRKLGGHHSRVVISTSGPALSPALLSGNEEKKHSKDEMNLIAAFQPTKEENGTVGDEKVLVKKPHHSMDKSIAGGGVILGGLATTFLVAIFCYIRATGRKNSDTTAELS